MYVCIYIYIYVYTGMCVYTYIIIIIDTIMMSICVSNVQAVHVAVRAAQVRRQVQAAEGPGRLLHGLTILYYALLYYDIII